MGLIAIKEVEGNSILGLWELDEKVASIASNLTAIPKSQKITSFKRKKEYVATRLLLDVMYAGTEINYYTSGKPYLINNEAFISISHSGNVVGLLLNRNKKVGLDVQFINPRIHRLKTKFLNNAELNELSHNESTEVLHIYWCAKEALYKYLDSENVNFISHLQIAPFEFGVSGHVKGNVLTNNISSEIILSYEMMGNYCIVYTVEN